MKRKHPAHALWYGNLYPARDRARVGQTQILGKWGCTTPQQTLLMERLYGIFAAESRDTLLGSANQPMQGMLSQEQHLPANLCHRADGEEPSYLMICLLRTLTQFPQLLLRGPCM